MMFNSKTSIMNLGFLGIGRIATAVIKGFCTSKIKNVAINVSPRSETNSIFLEKSYPNVIRMKDNQSVLDNSDLIFIALPPKDAKQTLRELKFNKKHTVISFVPFLEYAELAKGIMPAKKICRAVPFPTVEKHNCPILLFNSTKTVSKIFEHIGSPIIVENEADLHVLWTLTGLIAPFYDLCETLSNWAQSKGVQPATTNKYVMDMFSSLTSSTKGENILEFS
ncbi:MAG TPA: NAD(P)-binding domain-containing protein, partial [Flavitalea sp.]|nr:NAD(P)-binding domain-containing protein [Flavitalea sp.]